MPRLPVCAVCGASYAAADDDPGAPRTDRATADRGAREWFEGAFAAPTPQLVFAALQILPGSDPLAGGEALCVMLAHHGERDGARYLAQWLKTRGS